MRKRLRSPSRRCRSSASRRGYPFAVVRPRGDRNFEAHTVSIVFAIDEGPRTYIERINVRGNTRTRDYVIRREFDISEGDAYNRALVDRAERRLKNLDFFKTVKITTEPGSSSDRVILNVDLEEKSTGDFSVSGGYSTVDGPLAEVSVSERNLLGRGLYAKASVTYGEYARGVSLSFVEPYLLDYRVALGLDVYLPRAARQRIYFIRHPDHWVLAETGIPASRGSEPAASIFDLSAGNLAAAPRSTTVTIFRPSTHSECRSIRRQIILFRFWVALIPPATPRPVFPGLLGCRANLRCRFGRSWLNGPEIDLGSRLFAGLQHAGQQQEPDRRSAHRLQTGLRRCRRRRYLSEVLDRCEILHAAGCRHCRSVPCSDRYAQSASAAASFECSTISRWVRIWFAALRQTASVRGSDLLPYTGTGDALGGTKYWGASVELQVPFWFLPKEIGLKGAVHADAGSLWDYQGPTQWAATGEVNGMVNGHFCNCGMVYDDANVIRSSAGVGLIWSSPFGPLRFDYSIPITKGKYDIVQQFMFGGGTQF